MKGLFWVIALFAMAVAVALGARMNDGYVLFVVPPWRAEISLNLLLLLLLAGFILGYLLLRGVLLTAALPRLVGAYRKRRQQEKSGAVFQDAVRLLFEGRFGQALRRAGEAHAAGVAPGLSALIAARAAQRLREPARQQEWLARAKRDDTRNESSALMLEAEMLVEEGRFVTALQVLTQLQGRQGRHIAALRLELRARQGVGDWDGVLKLLRSLAKRDALPGEMVEAVRTRAHLANIDRHVADPEALVAYLHALPPAEREPRVVIAAASALTALGKVPEAQQLIDAGVDAAAGEAAWLGELWRIYGGLDGAGQTARIARAERWLSARPDDAGLLLALGRMCFRQRLWGKAQSYFEASLALAETQAAHLELARLSDQLGRTDEANQHYRASARLQPA